MFWGYSLKKAKLVREGLHFILLHTEFVMPIGHLGKKVAAVPPASAFIIKLLNVKL